MNAWNDYLAHDNHGRGIVLIGHSEGSGEATLIVDRMDRLPAVRTLLVSAIITGLDLPVTQAGLGPFATVGPCASETQTGCVVGFNAFSEPPPSNTMFGKAEPMVVIDGQKAESLCTNPSDIGGGSGRLISMYRTKLPTEEVAGSSTEGVLMGHPPVVATPWVEYDGQYTGSCVTSNGSHVLIVEGERGAPVLTAYPDARWGLHVDDPNIAMGNLVSLVHSEIESYVAIHKPNQPAQPSSRTVTESAVRAPNILKGPPFRRPARRFRCGTSRPRALPPGAAVLQRGGFDPICRRGPSASHAKSLGVHGGD